jgi:ribosomal protein S18 acetylase RimI-like enzyme
VIEVSAAMPQDVQAMAALLEEMDRFYETPTVGPRSDRVRRISEALFASPPAAYAMLARDGAVLAGVAAYSFLWPAVGLTRSLYLKDLYVADAYRRRGVGRLLMQALAEEAGKHKCSRVEWTTDVDNVGAQAFYRDLGAPEHTSKIFYRVEDTGRGFLPI